MKIGIFIKNNNEIELFKNGCNQQALFVYKSILKIKNSKCYFIVNGTQKKKFIDYDTFDFLDNYNNLILKLDCLIYLSQCISNKDYIKDLKDHNIKTIHYNCGNIYYIYQEEIIFGKHNYIEQSQSYFLNDAIWHIPNYEKNLDFFRALSKNNENYIVPYVWDDTILKRWIEDNNYNIKYDKNHSNSETKLILICEPNVQTTKTCLIPLLICEKLFNSGYENFEICCLCTPENDNFQTFLNSLNIYINNKIQTYPRLIFWDVLKQLKSQEKDVYIISHHENNPLNFLHLETLYLGYPLIHNSEPINEAGYYYQNIEDAVDQIKYAFENHKKISNNYLTKAIEIIDKFNPLRKNNINNYKKLLDTVCCNNVY